MTQSGSADKQTGLKSKAARSLDLNKGQNDQSDPLAPLEQRAASGLSVQWIPYGAHLISATLPDRTPLLAELPSPKYYSDNHPFVGSFIGRVANRIEKGRFQIDGQTHQVATSSGGHALHGGPDGFFRKAWDVTQEGNDLIFCHSSPSGHQGYPGNLDVTLRSRLTDQELQLTISATTDAPTPVNLTHHGYWNPSGLFDQPLNSLFLQTPADRYMVVDETLIPTGETRPVSDTDYDFRHARMIGDTPLDVNLFVPGEGLREMARLSDGVRAITILSDYPGFQVFTGETLGKTPNLMPRAALAIEPQYPPNAINRPVNGFDTLLRPGETYKHQIIYHFEGPGFKASDQ